MTVQERNVQIGCTWLTCSSNLKKKKKIRYQNTESDVCKWHCQYEVDNNECEYLTDCEWLISEVMMMLRGWVWVQESDGLGEETPPKSLSFCHRAAEALTRWQQSEKTVSGVIWVFDDFDSSASAAFEVDVLQRGEHKICLDFDGHSKSLKHRYSGERYYLIPCWFCMFAHWQRNDQSIILMLGLF